MVEMALPLVPQDLSEAETYRQISASLLALQSTSEAIFDRMRVAIIQRAGMHFHRFITQAVVILHLHNIP